MGKAVKSDDPISILHRQIRKAVKMRLYMVSKEGEVVSFELEAYIVRNMKVPLLLGEDFQSSYKLGV